VEEIEGTFGKAVICDCVDGLKALGDHAYELGCTDPPWGIEWKGWAGGISHKTPKKARRGGAPTYYEDNPETQIEPADWFPELQRVTERQIVFPGTQNIFKYLEYGPQEIGGYYNPMPTLGSTVAVFKAFGPVIFFNLPFQTFMHSMIPGPTLSEHCRAENIVHPCPRPIQVVEYFCTPREGKPPFASILDPFLGSGTLAEVCEAKGIKWLGFEKNPAYIPDIRRRIARGQKKYRTNSTLANWVVIPPPTPPEPEPEVRPAPDPAGGTSAAEPGDPGAAERKRNQSTLF
jgi:hypothetical protein